MGTPLADAEREGHQQCYALLQVAIEKIRVPEQDKAATGIQSYFAERTSQSVPQLQERRLSGGLEELENSKTENGRLLSENLRLRQEAAEAMRQVERLQRQLQEPGRS